MTSENLFRHGKEIVLVVHYNTPQEERVFTEKLRDMLVEERGTLLIDFSAPVNIKSNSVARKMRSDFFKENHRVFKDRCIATALVMDTTKLAKVKAGLLQALFWVVPPPFPLKTFTDMNDARDWLELMRKEEDDAR